MSSSSTGALDPEMVNDWSSEFATVHHHEVLVDAGHHFGMPSLCIDRAQVRKHEHVFSNIIPLEGKATSQKSSGRYVFVMVIVSALHSLLLTKIGALGMYILITYFLVFFISFYFRFDTDAGSLLR